MKRSDVINALSTTNNAASYLEIGVEAGVTFADVMIQRKTAVDPVFRFDISEYPDSYFYEMTSDAFFARAILANEKYDIIFIDGLHHWEVALRDVINAIRVSHEQSIIVIDDVLPTDFYSQLRSYTDCARFKESLAFQDRNWMGDVYKIIPYIHHLFTQWSYATLRINHGETVLWRQPRTPPEGSCLAVDYSDVIYQRIPYCFCAHDDLLDRLRSFFLSDA